MLADYPVLLPIYNNLLTDPFSQLSLSAGRPTSVSHMDTIWRGYSAEDISGEVVQLILSGWSKRHKYCIPECLEEVGQLVYPTEKGSPVYPFLDFLANLFFEECLQYRPINTIRSAVSMTHSHIEGVPMGQHPLMSRMFKGIYN